MPTADLSRLIAARDLPALIRALRSPADPALRLAAVGALGKLGDYEAVESLIRASLQDPDGQVRTAASAVLQEMLGPEARTAVEVYRSGSPDIDPWLTGGPDWEGEDQEEDEYEARLDDQYARGGLPALLRALRSPADVDLRMSAAAIIGSLNDLNGVQPLVRASLEDPDEDVRAAAFEALRNLVGAQADYALQYARSLPPEPDAWLREPDLEELAEMDLSDVEPDLPAAPRSTTGWDDEHLYALTTLIRKGNNLPLQLKAVRQVAELGTPYALDALANVALWSREPELRAAAVQAFHEIYGDDYQQVLDSYRAEGGSLEDEDVDDAEAAGEAAPQPAVASMPISRGRSGLDYSDDAAADKKANVIVRLFTLRLIFTNLLSILLLFAAGWLLLLPLALVLLGSGPTYNVSPALAVLMAVTGVFFLLNALKSLAAR